MSDEMAVSDNATGDEATVNSDEAAASTVAEAEEVAPEQPSEPAAPQPEESPAIAEEPEAEMLPEPAPEEPEAAKTPEEPTVKEEPTEEVDEQPPPSETEEVNSEIKSEKEDTDIEPTEAMEAEEPLELLPKSEFDDKRGIKRRASEAFSDAADEEFKGFDDCKLDLKTEYYNRVLERLEAEVSVASRGFVPVRHVMATPPAATRAGKRPRKDTDSSRPSSALSSRSDGDGATDASAASSPAARGGRRATTEMSSPLLRVPLERGWKRELVYRAALDSHSRRNADIYYYTPQGKKLRSSREVGDNLAGTGLTLENFSFFKEPLGVDDPEKEIIRDAKLMRRVESPVAAAAPVEGKRTPKPRPPKGASPDPPPLDPALAAAKSPPAKIKVKSVGSRLSGNTAPAQTPSKQQKKPLAAQQPTTPSTTDNNNSAAWKKPRPPALQPPAPAAPPAQPAPPAHTAPPAPPPLQSRPPHHPADPVLQVGASQQPRQAVQPCSMSCGRGAVPSLSCGACLCLYHPACAGYLHHPPPDPFFCKNCRKSSSPPLEPPPLTHKSGVTAASVPVPVPVPIPVPVLAPVPRRIPIPVPVPVPVPVPAKVPRDKRVLLRMKVAGGGADGERVWAVAGTQPQPPPAAPQPQPQPQVALPQPQPTTTPRARAPRVALPQGLAVLNGRRFIVVPRSMVHSAANHEDKRLRARIANGAASPPAGAAGAAGSSPRRRGRARQDDTDHFTAFCNRAKEQANNYNVAVQIFQYLGMRDLAHSARVCKLWRELAATPALWRHVRMKNSHVSDWAGLCAALKRHGTKRLDLRKMLLPQNDTVFWDHFAQHISTVDTLERIEMCRCPARAVEAVCRGVPGLRALSALAIRDALLDPAPLAALPLLHELRLKSMAGLSLTQDLRHLAALTRLQHLSLTSIKELGWCACDVIGSLPQLESLELGECTFRAEFAGVLARLGRLRRLRLERGTPHCAAPDILRAVARLPLLTRLELVNIDVKVGFDDALAECKNIQRLLIIPTYVSQSATTNKQVLSGVLRLKDTLTHLMWGVTIELLRVTELFIDQCEASGDAKRRDVGECIPVLKPVPGCKLPDERCHVAGPPQVEILPLPTLQRLLSAQLPTTKLKLLRIPFHATWRQSLADFQ